MTDTPPPDPGTEPPVVPDDPGALAPPRRPRRSPGLLAAVVVLVACVVVGLVLFGPAESGSDRAADPRTTPSGRPDPTIILPGRDDPQPAPPFSVVDFKGKQRTLESFRGRPLVLNFWASWCVPCKAEMPAFERLYRTYGGRVQFLGIASGDTEAAARAFATERDITYPLALDRDDSVSASYSLFGLPSTYFVDADGVVVDSRAGEMSEAELNRKLRELFPKATRER